MLAKFSIRAKITAVVALLLIPMMGMALFSVWTMQTIHANAVVHYADGGAAAPAIGPSARSRRP